MKNGHSTRRLSLALLIVMLLNPVLGLAGSLSFAGNLSGEELLRESVSDQHQQMDSAHCHESEMNQLADSNMPIDDDCCEDICQCSQAGCHAPVASIGAQASLVNADSPYSLTHILNYLSPSLSSQTPPPII